MSDCRDIKFGYHEMPRKLTTSEWVQKAKAIHGDRYDYSLVNYKGAKSKVIVVCPEHGAWDCQPTNHVSHKRGCPICGGSTKKTTSDFAAAASDLHGAKYDYSNVTYENAKDPVEIGCPIHGKFWQSPDAHLRGQGCPKCGNARRLDDKKAKTLKSIIERLALCSDGIVQIVPQSFSTINEKAEFICEKHGKFSRLVNTALYSGHPCLECFYNTEMSAIYSQHRAEEKVKDLLQDGISFRPFRFEGAQKTKVKLSCVHHGEWEVTFSQLIRRQGKCPTCSQLWANSKRSDTYKVLLEQSSGTRFSAYLEKFKELHGDRYDYSLAEYGGAKSPISIICPAHGVFKQTPADHSVGGCRQCADEELAGLYSERYFELRPELRTTPAQVYCLELDWRDGHCFKFGITRNTLKKRFAMALASKVRIDVLAVCETTLLNAWHYENLLLSNETCDGLRYRINDPEFARTSRIGTTELLIKLPNGWSNMIPWTEFPQTQLA